ncbi:MAG: T9SS type A sorting domain-containing protein [Gemmatimonadetes bacterium]|nr:T9SS type A sorting domain-containing protein [Gemmatimonadota bacterium]
MTRVCGPLAVLLLALSAFAPDARAQKGDTVGANYRLAGGLVLEQNYPNPVRPDTRIPFVLGEDLFADGRPVVASVRIFNVLRQLVAVPTALDHPSQGQRPLLELEYQTPGRYLAYWDGKDSNGQPVASGIYFYQIVANGKSQIRKLIVAK